MSEGDIEISDYSEDGDILNDSTNVHLKKIIRPYEALPEL